jgi:CheY-like chemotaxis protein
MAGRAATAAGRWHRTAAPPTCQHHSLVRRLCALDTCTKKRARLFGAGAEALTWIRAHTGDEVDELHNRLDKLNVMVVDHNPWTRLHVTTALDALGVSVAEVSNGATALRRAQAEAPHVVIVASELPEMDAPELLDGLRSDPRTRHTAVVGLSNVADGDAELNLPCTVPDVLTSLAIALQVREETRRGQRHERPQTGTRPTCVARVAPTLAPRQDRRGARLSKR